MRQRGGRDNDAIDILMLQQAKERVPIGAPARFGSTATRFI